MTASPSTMHPSALSLYHRNPRVGDVAAIAGSLRANGQYKPIVVNRGTYTGRPHEVLAGNHTLTAIRDLAEQHPDDERWQNVLVHVIDVDEDRAARIVLADNRTAEVGTMDDEALADLLDELGGDLDGTGYTDADLAAIADTISGPPSLDALEEEAGGAPTDTDTLDVIRLQVPAPIVEQWNEHRRGFENDADALAHLLDGGV